MSARPSRARVGALAVIDGASEQAPELRDVARCVEQAVASVDDVLRHAPARPDHGQSGGHRLEHNRTERLGEDRRMDEEVELLELALDVAAKPGELGALGDAEVGGELLELAAVVRLAEDRRADDDVGCPPPGSPRRTP